MLHVVKVRRYGGGYSIIDITTKKKDADALAKEFNRKFNTRAYFVDSYRSQDEYGSTKRKKK